MPATEPRARTAAPDRGARPAATSRWLTIVVGLLILGLAIGLRFPLLEDVPRFTDESDDMLIAYALSTGQEWPLVNFSTYIGVLLTYLVAPVYALFGPRLLYARLVVALMGLVALVPTYLLGRRLGGHWGGLAAAAMLAGSAPHALLDSRVAWSHSMTPLFATLMAWLLHRAVELKHGPSLALAGLAAGLALQTHPTVAAVLPGGLLYLLLGARGLVRTRWVVAAGGLAIGANLNLIVYNLLTGGESVTRGQQVLGDYAVLDRSPNFRGAALEMLVSGTRLLSAGLSDNFMTWPPLWNPVSVVMVLAVTGAVGWLAYRRQPLPLLLVGSALLLLPGLLGRFEPLMTNGRYLMPVLPICLAALGAVVARIGASRAGRVVGVAAIGALVGWHSWITYGYLADSVERGLTNARFREAEPILIEAARTSEVIVDADLYDEGVGGGGKLNKLFRYTLKVHGIPYRILADPASAPVPPGESRVVVLRTSSLGTFAGSQVTPLLPAAKGPPGGRFGIYRVVYPARRG